MFKWRCHDDVRIRASKHFLAPREGKAMDLTVTEVSKAFATLKREHRIGHYGVCLSCLWNVFCARDDAFTFCLNEQIKTSTSAALSGVKGRFYSKVKGSCFPRQTRAILPAPCRLELVDTIIAVRCTEFLISQPPPDSCFIEAARKGRSTTDVVLLPDRPLKKEWIVMVRRHSPQLI